MINRKAVLALVGILAICSGDSKGSENWCDSVCPTSKACPTPQCPSLPDIPQCPSPHCPAPVINLTCPEPRCPPCPACAPPSPVPTCPTCPTCPPPSSKASLKTRPEGYKNFPGAGMYKFYPEELTWMNANRTCSRDGGYLAIPKSVVELNALQSVLEDTSTITASIGFHDFNNEGRYTTALGEPMSRYQHSLWGFGEPKGGFGMNAVSLRIYGKISEHYNAQQHPFICELP